MSDWIGYQWLAEHYGVSAVQPFRTDSAIAKSRSTLRDAGRAHEIYPPSARPVATLARHLTFALKHEDLHLEFLARLFRAIPATELAEWIATEPTGQYARRAGFFYETLTGRPLAFPGVVAGNYIPAIDPDRYLTAVQPVNNQRWRVRDNLPGTRDYCPLVKRTDRVRRAEQYDCAQHLADLETEFGADLLRHSAVWLTIKESRASFAIEHEQQHADRVRRFASVMEQRCGHYDDPLTEGALAELQSQILGPRTMRHGVRRSPVFIGEVDGFTEVVHYIAPHWDDIPGLLSGLRAFAARTIGASPLVRAAVLSFGFVYVHPMSDGNGRISRFLINDVLRRDQALPAPFILPVSATINSATAGRRSYEQVLESFSRPLMRKYADAWRFGAEQLAADGVRYNLQFDSYADALPAWRYPDLTDHVETLFDIVQATIETEMRKEAGHLRALRLARERIKNVLEGPDNDIDRIIRSVRQNGGRLTNKLLEEFPMLAEEALGKEIVAAIEAAFDRP